MHLCLFALVLARGGADFPGGDLWRLRTKGSFLLLARHEALVQQLPVDTFRLKHLQGVVVSLELLIALLLHVVTLQLVELISLFWL